MYIWCSKIFILDFKVYFYSIHVIFFQFQFVRWRSICLWKVFQKVHLPWFNKWCFFLLDSLWPQAFFKRAQPQMCCQGSATTLWLIRTE